MPRKFFVWGQRADRGGTELGPPFLFNPHAALLPKHTALPHLASAVTHKELSNGNLGLFLLYRVYSLIKLRKSKYCMKQGMDIKK